MSLFSSLRTGASGLTSSGADLGVIGNNIANANTVGFKRSRTNFEDAFSETLLGAGQLGKGVNIQSVQRLMAQGSLLQTGVATDLAIQGDGFFVVNGSHAGQSGSFYTRAGQLTVDDEGFLVTTGGLRVQGYDADPTGQVSASLSDLQFDNAAYPPNASGELTITANLDADADIIAGGFDVTDIEGTSSFQTSVSVYDSLGNAHQIDVHFTKTADGAWSWNAVTDGANVGGTAGDPTVVASGTMSFDTDGKLTDVTTTTNNFTPNGATSPQPLNFNFGEPTSAGGTGLGGTTGFANPSAVSFINQDGYPSGDLSSIAVDPNGQIMGTFSNGQTRVLGQVALAEFQAPDQLKTVGGNLFTATLASGEPNVGRASEGGRGALVAGALEQSNVDLSAEFIEMIEAQRHFQANSKTVTTADNLLAELIQLKR